MSLEAGGNFSSNFLSDFGHLVSKAVGEFQIAIISSIFAVMWLLTRIPKVGFIPNKNFYEHFFLS